MGPDWLQVLNGIVTSVKEMRDGQCLVVPTGWTRLAKDKKAPPPDPAQSAVLGVLHKLREGEYSFALCNTGEGLEFHVSAPTSDPKP